MASESSTVLVFYPPRQPGVGVHAALLPLPAVGAALALVWAIRSPVGEQFGLAMTLFVVLAGLVPWLGYRLYALNRAAYTLEREGIRIQWGLRVEDIPMPAVRWVRRPQQMEHPPPLPWLGLPGAVLGVRQVAGLGEVEYLAADRRRLVLIATERRVYAISPEEPQAFLEALQGLIEMGSLAPLPARSERPVSLLSVIWADRAARGLLLAGSALGLAVVVWVGLLISAGGQVSVGFTGPGSPRQLGPAVRLTLLPVLNGFFLLADWGLGTFLYRRPENRPVSYLLWAAGALTSGLFLLILALAVGQVGA